jgi:hypothetical protein
MLLPNEPLTDAVRIFNWFFLGGEAPPAPTPSSTDYVTGDCGVDETPDRDGDLGCVETSETCSAGK